MGRAEGDETRDDPGVIRDVASRDEPAHAVRDDAEALPEAVAGLQAGHDLVNVLGLPRDRLVAGGGEVPAADDQGMAADAPRRCLGPIGSPAVRVDEEDAPGSPPLRAHGQELVTPGLLVRETVQQHEAEPLGGRRPGGGLARTRDRRLQREDEAGEGQQRKTPHELALWRSSSRAIAT